MQPFKAPIKSAPKRNLQVFALHAGGIGFTTSSLPKLRGAVSKLSERGGKIVVSHNLVTSQFFDTGKSAYAEAEQILSELCKGAEFEGSTVGFAEGEIENEIDVMRITCAATKRNGSNQSKDPTA
jgi:hypothetical protein